MILNCSFRSQTICLSRLAVAGTMAVFLLIQPAGEPAFARDQIAATAWIKKDRYARARLIAGNIMINSQKTEPYAAIQIRLADGWKTYWRTSGDAAGVPPHFDFSGSENVKQAKVLYPAPVRFDTPDGDSIGYKKKVTFPIRLIAEDPSKPMTVKLKLFYGVCAEICIPAEANFNVTMRMNALPRLMDGPLVRALSNVPRQQAGDSGATPRIKMVRAEELDGAKPRVIVEVVYPAGVEGADLFVEGPDEAYVPQPQKAGKPRGNSIRYVINLSEGADLADLKNKPLRLTMVSKAGHAETSWILK